MKKLFFACFFVIGVSAVSFAQGGPGGRPAQTPEAQLERLKTQITGITPDQETKLKAVYAAGAVRQDSLMKALGDGADRTVMREKRAPITAATNAKIKAILTADQQKAFDALPQGRGGFGGGAPGAGGPPRN